jgi:hypothetical protein
VKRAKVMARFHFWNLAERISHYLPDYVQLVITNHWLDALVDLRIMRATRRSKERQHVADTN